MGRPQRVIFENAYYHVMNRGASRGNIFFDEEDKKNFLGTLSDASNQYDIEIHAYCLMDNHYHLLIKTPKANISRAMRHLNGVYTQRYNRRHDTDGALFRGRYKAILIDSDAYLLHLTKYIHLNPLSAKMVEQLEDYEWSSYLAYIGKRAPRNWLVLHEVYEQLTQGQEKTKHYQRFMLGLDLKKEIVNFYRKANLAPILGGSDFVDSLKTQQPSKETPKKQRINWRPTIEEIIDAVSTVVGTSMEDLVRVQRGPQQSNVGRKIAMHIARKHADYRLADIAEAFGLSHYGSASSAIHGFSGKVDKDNGIRKILNDALVLLEGKVS